MRPTGCAPGTGGPSTRWRSTSTSWATGYPGWWSALLRPRADAGGAGPGPGGVLGRYGAHRADKTAPYAGMPEAVERLRAAGVRTAVLSNKAHALAGPVVEDYYPGQFPGCRGPCPACPQAGPHPAAPADGADGGLPGGYSVRGDSNVDIRTARNGGLTGCGVLWGFRGRRSWRRRGRLSGPDAGGAGKGGAGRWLRLF